MREVQRDRRPRILDFSTWIGNIKPICDLAWPCYAFRVTVPVRPAGRLNVFEETVLKLLGNARLDESALVETTCLDSSLVKLVCCRLRDAGLLTERNELTPLGRTSLSLAEEEGLEYELRLVFRERISGTLLPVVLGQERAYEEVIRWSEKERWVDLRKKSRQGLLRARLLPARNDAALVRPPTPADVLWAANRHQVLSRQYSVLRRGVEPCPPVGSESQLNVDPTPESLFLRCRVVIPTTSDDYQLGDPFGYGFSENLFRAYEALRAEDPKEEQYIGQVRERTVTVRTKPAHAETSDEAKAVLSRLADAVTDDKDLFAKLRQFEKELRLGAQPPQNSAEEDHFAYYRQQAAQSMSEALETVLGRVAAGARAAASEKLLSSPSQTHQQNKELLEGLALRIGLQTRGIGGLLRVPPGRVRELRVGAVDLQALVAVSLTAAVEDRGHPLHRIVASGFRDWLQFLHALKAARDGGAHGQSRAAGAVPMAQLREGMYRSIELLLPGLWRTDTTERPADTRPSMIGTHDDRRQAISRLERCFGVRWYAELGTDVAELLIQVELAAGALRPENSEPVNVIRLVGNLASVLQELVHARQHASAQDAGRGGSLQERAQQRATQAGLLKHGVRLPPCMEKVNPRRLQEAVQGSSPSLGASLMALLILAPMRWLRRLAKTLPDFLPLCEQVIELRGHVNRPVFMSAAVVLKLKDQVYRVCDGLMEA